MKGSVFLLTANYRKGKSIVKRRVTTEVEESDVFDTSIDHAFKEFISLKKILGVRDRTMHEYYTLMDYFLEWLNEKHPDIKNVNNINSGLIRGYIVYLKEERFNERTQLIGLSPFTINVRIRFLKTFFNTLFKEEIINKNPARNISLMKVDEDNFNPLTDVELTKLLS